MLKVILDAICYCCYREKRELTTESVLEHLEGLAEHEVKFIVNKIIKSRNMIKSCC